MNSKDRADSEEIKVGEAAALLGVHPTTIRNWGALGKLTEIRVGARRDRRYLRLEVMEMLNNRHFSNAAKRDPNIVSETSDIRAERSMKSIIGQPRLDFGTSLGQIIGNQQFGISKAMESVMTPNVFSTLGSSFTTPFLTQLSDSITAANSLSGILPQITNFGRTLDEEGKIRDLFGKQTSLASIFTEQKAFAIYLSGLAQWTAPAMPERLFESILPARQAANTFASIAANIGRSDFPLEQAQLSMTAFRGFSSDIFNDFHSGRSSDISKYLALSKFEAAGSVLNTSLSWINGLTQFVPLHETRFTIELVQPTFYEHFKTEVLEREDEYLNTEPDSIASELKQTLTMQISQTATRIIETRVAINRSRQLSGLEVIFHPTIETELIACMLPQHVASSEEEFKQFTEWLFKFIYESSGALQRVTQLLPVPKITMDIKHLRNYYAHDLEHGKASDIEKKYENIGSIFIDLVGSATLGSSRQWQLAQLRILGRIERFLQELCERL